MKMHMVKAVSGAVALALLAGGAFAPLQDARAGSPPAAAAQAPSPARDFIQGMGDQVIGYLKDGGMDPADKKAKLRAVLNARFDMDTISRFALGRYWKDLSPAQQAEYRQLFENMVVSMYAERFSTYSGQEFRVLEARPLESDTLVMSSIIDPDGEKKTLAVNWRVRAKDGQPRIVDVTIEDVSMIVTQRSEFASLIQREGGKAAAVIDHLRGKAGG